MGPSMVLYAWEFEKAGHELRAREGLAQSHIGKNRLKRVFADWCPPFSGYHLWYPSRRESSAAFAFLVEALRYRGCG